ATALWTHLPDVGSNGGWHELYIKIAEILPPEKQPTAFEAIFFALFSYTSLPDMWGRYINAILPYMGMLPVEAQIAWLDQLSSQLEITLPSTSQLWERQSFTAYIVGVLFGKKVEEGYGAIPFKYMGDGFHYLKGVHFARLIDRLYKQLQSYPKEENRALGIASIAYHLAADAPAYNNMFNEAWGAATQIKYDDSRAATMAYIATRMSADRQLKYAHLALEELPEPADSLVANRAVAYLATALPFDEAMELLAKQTKHHINDIMYSTTACIAFDHRYAHLIDDEMLEKLIGWWIGQARMTEPLSLAYIFDALTAEQQRQAIDQITAQTLDELPPRATAYSLRHLLPYATGKAHAKLIEQYRSAVAEINFANELLRVSVSFGRTEELAHRIRLQPSGKRADLFPDFVSALYDLHCAMQGGEQSKMHLTDYVSQYFRIFIDTLTTNEVEGLLAEIESPAFWKRKIDKSFTKKEQRLLPETDRQAFRPHEFNLLAAWLWPRLHPDAQREWLQLHPLPSVDDLADLMLSEKPNRCYARLHQFALLISHVDAPMQQAWQAAVVTGIQRLPARFKVHVWCAWVFAFVADDVNRAIYLNKVLEGVTHIADNGDARRTIRDMTNLLPLLSAEENSQLCRTLLQFSSKMDRVDLLRILPIWQKRFEIAGLSATIASAISQITQLIP
ncbi:MAG: hypothetical protein ACPG8W_21450, partial [Candidatus Promineifilaceae bacterium]